MSDSFYNFCVNRLGMRFHAIDKEMVGAMERYAAMCESCQKIVALQMAGKVRNPRPVVCVHSKEYDEASQ